MSGERDLDRLLANAEPVLGSETYVFLTTGDPAPAPDPSVFAMVREEEGLTLIAEKGWAEAHGFEATFPCRRITLNVHSSLSAVGLIAAVAGALAEAGISTNSIAGFYHDHLFVPKADAEQAMEIIKSLSETTRRGPETAD